MKDEIVNRLDKYYGYAHKIAGELGSDLLHHVLTERRFFQDMTINEHALDGYIYRTLRNAYINEYSSFYKAYRKKPNTNPDDTPTGGYDIIKLHTLLLMLELEGHERHVKVFKECYFGQGKKSFCKQTGLHYRTVQRICNFVREEIKERYEH